MIARLAGAKLALAAQAAQHRGCSCALGCDDLAALGDAGETWYAKPAGGKMFVSPADATPVDPHDAYADDMLLAEGIDRFQQAIDLSVERVERTGAAFAALCPTATRFAAMTRTWRGFLAHRSRRLRHPDGTALSRLAAALIREKQFPPTSPMRAWKQKACRRNAFADSGPL